jgi:hypothetical protein
MAIADRDTEAEFIKPRSFDELKVMPITCKRCGGHPATHTLSMTVAQVGKGRGSVVTQVPRVPVCESCGVDVFLVFKKALKA